MSGPEDLSDIPSLSEDPRTLAIARRLLKTDFSRESRLRVGLRARLLAIEKPRPFPVARLAVCATALAAALLVPFRTVFNIPEHALPLPRGSGGLPVLPGFLAAREPARPEELFDTLPAQDLVATRRVDRLIETAAGRIVPLTDGRAIRWEINGAVYSLETRRTSLKETFKNGGMQ